MSHLFFLIALVSVLIKGGNDCFLYILYRRGNNCDIWVKFTYLILRRYEPAIEQED